MSQSKPQQEFSDSKSYAASLEQGLAISGEGREYFASERLRFLRERLSQLGRAAGNVLDFGCGDGSTIPLFYQLLAAQSVTGVDTSKDLLAEAVTRFSSDSTSFSLRDTLLLKAQFELGFCNGVFHHIAVEERAAAATFIYERLAPDGLVAFWENNPWNPGTRLIMSRIEFDRDAITLTASEARTLLTGAGFEVLGTYYRFFFPRALAWLRPLEALLTSIPMGAQYMVLARKPSDRSAAS
ncbi:MAG: trans-aconitate methyltransferase [Planctomycetota bacterium]